MKDTIYLYADRSKITRMTKTLKDHARGEIPIKLLVEVSDDAFSPPSVEKVVSIDGWTKGIDLDDIQFNDSIITEEEAQIIREKRIEKMKKILEDQGYDVKQRNEEDGFITQ